MHIHFIHNYFLYIFQSITSIIDDSKYKSDPWKLIKHRNYDVSNDQKLYI